jgi:hypothetical protein
MKNPTGLICIVVGEEVKLDFWDGVIANRKLLLMHDDPSWSGRHTADSAKNKQIRLIDEGYVIKVQNENR